MKKTLLIVFLFLSFYQIAFSQESLFEESFQTLKEMLEDSTKYSFKKAVFSVENAFNYGTLDTIFINQELTKLNILITGLLKSRKLEYHDKDSITVNKYASLFTVLNDTIPIKDKNNEDYIYIPYRYDFDDPFGHQDWNSMFVSKLLMTGKGNCHSLPYLYKILAEEIGVDAHLALAPNHVYIKHRNKKDGWYNTELTSGIFPIDAWIMASGYVHLDAIVNGMYMKALNNKETIGVCLIDLAQAYENRFPHHNGDFVLKCSELALKQYPNFSNALLMNMEAKRRQIETFLRKKKAEFPNDISKYPETSQLFAEIQNQIVNVHTLGYRKMPEEMYLNWLVSLKEEREKYSNKKINTFNNTTN